MVMKLSVLIPDGEERIALHVVRCLAQVRQIKLYVLSSESQTWCQFSRCRHLYKFLPLGTDLEERVKATVEMVEQYNIDIILPVSTAGINFVTNKYEALSAVAAISPVPDLQTLNLAMDKWSLHQFAIEQQFPVPPTVSVNFEATFYSKLADLEYPVLLKPTIGMGGQGIQSFADPFTLQRYLEAQDVEQLRNKYVVQSYIPGLDLGLSVLCRHGEILAFTIQQGLIAERFGPLKAMKFIEQENVLEIGQKLLSALHWNGVAHIDMRYDERNGQIKIIEMNTRFWGSLLGSLVVGVNFPYLACQAALDIPFPTPQYQLGKYLHTGPAAKQLLLKPFGRSEMKGFAFNETGLKFFVVDPLPEIIDWTSRLRLVRRVRAFTARSTARGQELIKKYGGLFNRYIKKFGLNKSSVKKQMLKKEQKLG
jgi:predicted ATP-grasp superfamily ATP-dependent carboligase